MPTAAATVNARCRAVWKKATYPASAAKTVAPWIPVPGRPADRQVAAIEDVGHDDEGGGLAPIGPPRQPQCRHHRTTHGDHDRGHPGGSGLRACGREEHQHRHHAKREDDGRHHVPGEPLKVADGQVRRQPLVVIGLPPPSAHPVHFACTPLPFVCLSRHGVVSALVTNSPAGSYKNQGQFAGGRRDPASGSVGGRCPQGTAASGAVGAVDGSHMVRNGCVVADSAPATSGDPVPGAWSGTDGSSPRSELPSLGSPKRSSATNSLGRRERGYSSAERGGRHVTGRFG